MPPNQAQIDIIIRLQMDRARRDARQVQTFLAKISKAAAQTGKQGASGVDRLERSIQDLQYSTVAGFDAMHGANQKFDTGLKATKNDTDKLMQSYVDYSALAQDLAQSAGQIGAMGREAAQRRDLAESFNTLADNAGMSGDAIVKAMTKASKGTVDANTIMATSNMVLGAKFKTSSAEMAKMMEFARLKSKEYGVSVASAFQRMTLGAVKAEVEFLDEYGITIKLNDALTMYAKKLGKAKSALNANERSMALWNALLIQADEQLADFPDGIDKHTDAYERMEIKVLRATQAVGDFLDRSKIGPVMSIAAQAVQGLATVMTPLILMKGMAAKASMAHATALGVETAAMAAQNKTASGALLGRIKGAAAAKQAASKGGIVSRVAGKVAGPAGMAAKALTPTKGLGGTLGAAGLGTKGMAVAGGGILAASAAALAISYKGYSDLQKARKAATEGAKDDWDEFATSLQEMADEEASATEIAQRYARNRQGVSDALYANGNAIQDFTMAVVRNNVNEQETINANREKVKQIVFLASKAYPDYHAAMKAMNDELPKGAEATAALSEQEFTLKKRLAEVSKEATNNRDKFSDMAAAYRAAADASSGLNAILLSARAKADEELSKVAARSMRALGEGAAEIAKQALQDAGLSADDLATKMEALTASTDEASAEQRAAKDDLAVLAQGYALGVVELDRYREGLEQAKLGTLELTDAEREATATAKERRTELAMAAVDQQESSRIASDAIKNYASDADVARRTQEALSVAMGETSFAQIENRKELTLLAQGLALGTVSQKRYEKAVRESLDGVIDMTAAEREAITVANQRAQAVEQEADHLAELQQITANYQNQATQATEQHRVSQEQSSRAHAQRKEDIERQHQQRLADIERDYGRSVSEAALARDAVGILQARERREEELADAERTRAEGQAGEDRSFNETNRSAVESYQARLAEIDAARQEELGRVREMQRQETEALRQQQADMAAQIIEAQEAQTAKEDEEDRRRESNASQTRFRGIQAEREKRMLHAQEEAALTRNMFDNDAARVQSAQQSAQAVAQTWIAAYSQIAGAVQERGASSPRPPRPRGGRGSRVNMAGGGEGMVTGPRTFHVGRGEREFVHFGGDERQRAPASQMNVGGNVNLDLTSQLGQVVGPLADRLAEVLLPGFEDMLVGEVMEAMQQ